MRLPATGGRIVQAEQLENAPADVAERNLRDLVTINRLFGGHNVLRKLVAEIAAPDEQLRVLDVGAASGDMGRALQAGFPRATVISSDIKSAHLARATPPRLAANAFHLPFRDHTFDAVYCSLFLHHFTNEEASGILREFWRVARRAVIVIDLERHLVPYYFLPATRWLFGWQDIVVADGMVSVLAAWRPGELRQVIKDAELPEPRIRRHLPWFRISALIPKR